MYIDTHAHLNFHAFDKDLNEVINRAKNAGIEKIVIPGAKIDSSIKALHLSEKYPGLFAAVGIHPHHVSEFVEKGNDITSELTNLVQREKTVAVGEIGLDYYTYKNYPPITPEGKKKQKELLILQLKIALVWHKPVIFHCREAHDDMLELLTDFQERSETRLCGVFHCFGGNKIHLKKVLDLGFFIGFDGNITYEENQKLQELVIQTPLERLLLETDAPYLAPVYHRKQRNEPSYLTHIAAFINRLTGNSLNNIAEQTKINAEKLFSI